MAVRRSGEPRQGVPEDTPQRKPPERICFSWKLRFLQGRAVEALVISE
jgi:hypothetical protein